MCPGTTPDKPAKNPGVCSNRLIYGRLDKYSFHLATRDDSFLQNRKDHRKSQRSHQRPDWSTHTPRSREGGGGLVMASETVS